MSEQRSVSISEPPSEGEAAKVSSKRNYFQLLKRKLRSVTSLVRVNSFRQQKLPAWRPMLTIASVLATFILAAIALIVIGAGFLYVITSTQVFQLDYTQCMPLYGSRSCEQILTDWRARSNGSWPPPECTCWYKFTLKDHFRANVYVYYALSNYYQNHLHYVRSKDMEQFTGVSSADKDCEPFRTAPVVNSKGKVTHRPIVPCGTIANSLFNDTFTLWLIPANWSLVQVPLRRTGIAWKSDYSRFKNPSRSVFSNFTNPPFWGNKTIWDLDPHRPSNNGLLNEALIVWMRVAAFPDFWKLYGRVDHTKTNLLASKIPKGQYYLKINYNYPVSTFAGRKSFILANTNKTLGGGSYLFLAIIYLVVGGICVVSVVVLVIIHTKFSLSNEDFISFNEQTAYFFNRNGKEKIVRK